MDFNSIKKLYSERTLTKPELKKREEIAQAIEKDQPGIDMSKKMAIATATAKTCCKEDIPNIIQTSKGPREIPKDPFYPEYDNSAEEKLRRKIAVDKKLKNEDIDSLDEVSQYDAVVTYYRNQLHLDPYKLKGEVGKQLRAKIKASPAFHAWAKINHYESVELTDEDDQLDERVGAGLTTKDLHKHVTSLGWVQSGPSGSHNNYSHSNSSSIISIPRHAKDLNRITAMKILKQANNLDKKVAVTESVSRLTSNILEIAKAKIKSSKPSEDITFFSTGQDKKSKTKITPHDDCNTQT